MLNFRPRASARRHFLFFIHPATSPHTLLIEKVRCPDAYAAVLSLPAHLCPHVTLWVLVGLVFPEPRQRAYTSVVLVELWEARPLLTKSLSAMTARTAVKRSLATFDFRT